MKSTTQNANNVPFSKDVVLPVLVTNGTDIYLVFDYDGDGHKAMAMTNQLGNGPTVCYNFFISKDTLSKYWWIYNGTVTLAN